MMLEVCRYAGYEIAVAGIRERIAETFALWNAHWNEQGEEAVRHIPCNPNLAAFLATEDAGQFKYIAVTHEGALVGHFGLWLGTSKNSSRRVAGDDFFYIAPGHRAGQLGIKLIRYAQAVARDCGAEELSVSYRTFGSVELDPVLRRCGMKHTARVYSISFVETDHVL